MIWNKNHPARSHAFLSRLHDGDLEPSERAHFEAHRAHCKQCRAAAADFERALSLFRSARSSPPPADLANRVLRKVQSVGSSRQTPFGSPFSIDLRWAGAFAAALLVLLVATPLVLRQERKAPPSTAPIAVGLREREASQAGDAATAPARSEDSKAAQLSKKNVRAPEEAQALKKQEAGQASGDPGEPRADPNDKRLEKLQADEVAAAKPASDAKAESASAAPAPASAPAGRASAPSVNRLAAAAPPPPEPQGGEGAREQVIVSGSSPVLDRPARIVVQPLDALGSPPELEARPRDLDLNDLRGRSFVVLVDGQGRVLEVRETAAKTSPAPESNRRVGALGKEKDASASEPIKSLRFKPGERPRRLLVRVE